MTTHQIISRCRATIRNVREREETALAHLQTSTPMNPEIDATKVRIARLTAAGRELACYLMELEKI